VPLDCSLPLPYLLPPVKDRGKNQTGRGGEVVPPGLPSRMRGPRSGRKDPAAGRRRCGGASVLCGSGVTGGEHQGVARWGGAPTGARPAKTAVKRRGGGASRPGRVRHQSPATMTKASGPSRHPGGSIRGRRRRGWTGGRRAGRDRRAPPILRWRRRRRRRILAARSVPLLCLMTTGTADQRDPPGILRGRCPRRRLISPGAARRRRRKRKPRSKP